MEWILSWPTVHPSITFHELLPGSYLIILLTERKTDGNANITFKKIQVYFQDEAFIVSTRAHSVLYLLLRIAPSFFNPVNRLTEHQVTECRFLRLHV